MSWDVIYHHFSNQFWVQTRTIATETSLTSPPPRAPVVSWCTLREKKTLKIYLLRCDNVVDLLIDALFPLSRLGFPVLDAAVACTLLFHTLEHARVETVKRGLSVVPPQLLTLIYLRVHFQTLLAAPLELFGRRSATTLNNYHREYPSGASPP